MKWSKAFIAALLLGLEAGPSALACSSCGSGAADPVILNPLERQKLYLGLSVASGFEDVDATGRRRQDYGPDRRSKWELAYAHRLNSSLFASLDTGMGENRKGARAMTGLTDTTVNLRWTALMQDVTEPWIPQLQLVFSHRFKTTRSLQDSVAEHNLDSFGAGYDESFVGADLWFGMMSWLGGASVLYSRPWEEATRSGRLLVGPTQKLIGTVGYKPIEAFKIIGGVVQERRGGITLDGLDSTVPSDKLSQDLFLTLESLRPEADNLRLSLNQKAAFGRNRNTSFARTYTLAWMKTL